MEEIPFFGCINLEEREDRHTQMTEEFKRIGILEKVFWRRPQRHPQSGRVGCFESHLAVFAEAVRRNVAFAVVFEDDVRFSANWEKAFKSLLDLDASGIPWRHASLQNSGGEVVLTHEGDAERLPAGVQRGSFYFCRCYAVSKSAMEVALQQGVTRAHVDTALPVANWGSSFIIRPAAVLDVPSKSDNDWADGGWGPWMACKMQGVTHLPCVFADRWKTRVLPKVVSQQTLEAAAWSRFMGEPGAEEHLREGVGFKCQRARTRGTTCCFNPVLTSTGTPQGR